MTADQIIALKVDQYAALFPDPGQIETAYRALLKTWHPDKNHGDERAQKVAAQINVLRDEAEKAAAAGTWQEHNAIRVWSGKKELRFAYRHRATTAAGEMFLGRTHLLMLSRPDTVDLFKRAEAEIAMLPAAPAALRERISARLPLLSHPDLKSGDRYGYAFGFGIPGVRLSDILAKRGPLDPKHVAWVLTRLYDTACYFDFAEVVHLGIDIDHVFITPAAHEVFIAGWEYAARRGKPLAATAHARAVLGSALKQPRDRRNNLALIRALARACIGDPTGATLNTRKDLPAPFARWLQMPPCQTAKEEFTAWEKCREASFGKRRWLELAISPSDIYGA